MAPLVSDVSMTSSILIMTSWTVVDGFLQDFACHFGTFVNVLGKVRRGRLYVWYLYFIHSFYVPYAILQWINRNIDRYFHHWLHRKFKMSKWPLLVQPVTKTLKFPKWKLIRGQFVTDVNFGFFQWPILLTWFNFNLWMYKQLHAQWSVEWN